MLEKSRIEETDETKRVQRAGEMRNNLQKEVEDVEQKDTMAKFELFELKRVHEELQKSLIEMRKRNSSLVDPILEKLRREVIAIFDTWHLLRNYVFLIDIRIIRATEVHRRFF
jgi:hypothetical protein